MTLLKVYGSQGGECGSLNIIDKHKLIGNGTIKRCDFAGIGMTLLEELHHCGGGLFGLIYVQVMPRGTVHLLLPAQWSQILMFTNYNRY